MRISDWSSDGCSSDHERLPARGDGLGDRLEVDLGLAGAGHAVQQRDREGIVVGGGAHACAQGLDRRDLLPGELRPGRRRVGWRKARRSEEHTSELQSLMRISYAVFCLKKKKKQATNANTATRAQEIRLT